MSIPAHHAIDQTRVQAHGSIQGRSNLPSSAAAPPQVYVSVAAYMGIPYAEPPILMVTATDGDWHRFPEVAAYEWTPAHDCNPRKFDREALVRDMVEKGGWLLIGGEYQSVFIKLPESREALSRNRRFGGRVADVILVICLTL